MQENGKWDQLDAETQTLRGGHHERDDSHLVEGKVYTAREVKEWIRSNPERRTVSSTSGNTDSLTTECRVRFATGG